MAKVYSLMPQISYEEIPTSILKGLKDLAFGPSLWRGKWISPPSFLFSSLVDFLLLFLCLLIVFLKNVLTIVNCSESVGVGGAFNLNKLLLLYYYKAYDDL